MAQSNYTAAAAGGQSVAIAVGRSGGATGAVSVAYATSNGTAVAGTNYTAQSGTLSWAAGDASTKTIAVPLAATTFAGSKSFVVALSNATGGAALGTPSAATVAISGTAASSSSSSSSALSISVSGNHFIDASGSTVQLRGVNVSGLEFVAISGLSPTNPWGNQTGTATPNWSLIRSWGANAVRLPLNAASWLGGSCEDVGGAAVTFVNGKKVQDKAGQIIQSDPGGNYQATVEQSVADANAAGLYVILDLHWSAPNDGATPVCPNEENAMADADHAVAFWSSVATTFKGNPGVIFELFNEPFLGDSTLASSDSNNAWYYILNGGATETRLAVEGTPGSISLNWTTTGMQQLLNAVRAAGANNVVLTASDNWSQTMTDWLAYAPIDTAHQLGAAWHPYTAAAYGYPTQTGCPGLPACSAQEMAAVQAIQTAGYPVVATEYGDVITAQAGNSSPWASVLLPFADKAGISYLAWTWDDWPGSEYILITDAAGDPTNGYGTYIKQHYQCVAAGTKNCP